jgi:hypothetical protein
VTDTPKKWAGVMLYGANASIAAVAKSPKFGVVKQSVVRCGRFVWEATHIGCGPMINLDWSNAAGNPGPQETANGVPNAVAH